MAATDVDPLPQLLNEIANRFSKQQETEVVEMFSTTLDERYRSATTLGDVFDLLHRDNRINLGDTFLLEKCIRPIDAEKLIEECKEKHKKEISRLKKQETLLVRRQEVYEKVDSFMRNNHGLLLYGEAGVGKTFLAKDYLNLNQKDNFKEVDLRGVKDSNILIVKILQKFGFIKSVEDVDLKVLRTWLKKSGIKKRVILFLDNTDDFVNQENKIDDAKTTYDKNIAFSDVVETVVKAGGGLIKLLITSRNPSEKSKFNHILRSHKVDQLQKSFALELISRFNMPCQPSKEMLNEAVEICKFLPLNLNLVGGMLQNAGILLEDVNQIIQTYAEKKLKKISDKKLAKKKEIEISTLSILKVKFDKLGDTVQQGAVALSLFCRPFKINDVEFMFEDMMKTERLELILHSLKHLKVIQMQDDMVYDFHPMVRSFLESKSKKDHINPFYQQAKMKFIFKFRKDFKMIAELLQNSYDHAREVFQHDFGNFQLTLNIHSADGIPFFEDYYDLQHAFGLLKAMFKSEWRVYFFQKVADSYIKSGEDLMVSLYQCATAQSCAKTDPHRALGVLSQAKQHIKLARKTESKDVDQRQLIAVESLYSEATGNAWHSISKNSRKVSDVVEALDGFKEAYILRTKMYEKNSKKADIARALAGLGACQALHATILKDIEEKQSKKLIKEKLKIALDCFGKSLKMYEKCCRYSSEIPIILQNIGHAHLALENYKSAYKYCIEALQKEKDLKIDGSHSTAIIMFNIAVSCRELNKDAEALRFSKDGYLILKELLKNHPDTVTSLYQVAVIHHEQGMHIDAIEYYKKAFWMEEELPDNFHSLERMNIRRNMIVAFERAIKRGFTYLTDDMKEWKATFSELEKKEEEKKKMQVTYQQPQEAAESQKPGPSKAEVSEVTDVTQQRSLDEISLSLQSSYEDEGVEEEKNLGEFIDPGMVRVFMDADGGTCEFKYLGVTLDVPQDSIDNIELQISCVSPSDSSIRQNPLRLAFGDYFISDFMKIGPDGQSFRRPASLSIPYSIFEVPSGRHIVMKCLNEEENSWDSIQVELKKDVNTGNRIAVAEVLKTSIYVVCLLHDIATYIVPKSGIEISPFNEDFGVKVIFDEDTFETENVQIDVKLSLFTNNAVKRLELLGLKTTPVLHVDVANSEYLLKPVTIIFAIEEVVQKKGRIVILRDNNDTLEDVTDDVTEIAKSKNSISFKVDHFSSLGVIWSSYMYLKKSRIIEYLTDCLYPPLSVWFQVYGKSVKGDWSMCVACSQDHDMQRVKDKFEEYLRCIEKSHYNEGIYNGTKMKVTISGSYYIPEGNVSLLFKSPSPCYTKLFRVRNVEDRDESNDLVILGENDDEYTRFPLLSLKDDCSLSGSKADDSSDSVSDSEMESTGDPEPYRFFGLKLEKCDLGGVRIGIEEVHQLEKHRVLPDEYIEDIKSKIRKDTTISALKLTLLLLTKCYCEKPLKEGWLEMLFSKPGSVDCQSSLRKVLEFLERPCKDEINTCSDIGSFLELIYTQERVFKHSKVQKYFFKELGLKPGDRENIESGGKKSCELRKRMLAESFFVEDAKISCLFDVVKALLRTKTRIERENVKQARRIQRLLDDLGKHLEGIAFKNKVDENSDDGW